MVNIFNHTEDVAYLKSKGVYLITHVDTDVIYVGSTRSNFRTRWVAHLNGLYKEENKTGNRVLINIANKYGADGFRFKVLQEMNDSSEEEIRQAEAKWIVIYNSYKKGANCSMHTDCAFKGFDHYPMSEEQKIKYRLTSPTKKTVYVYDGDGNLLHTFMSSVEADRFFNLRKGRVSEKISRNISLQGKYFFSYEPKDWKPGEDVLKRKRETGERLAAFNRERGFKSPSQETRNKARLSNKKSKKVRLLDLDGNECFVFNSLNECDDFLNLTRGVTSKVLMHKNFAKALRRKYIPQLINN